MADNEIWIAGYPSFHGGADTELAHQILLLRAKGVRVMLVPLGPPDPAMKLIMDNLGCISREYKPGVFKDKVVLSFCNGDFLKRLPEIQEAGKPRAVAWANCMTWTFPNEELAHGRGWITHHMFQTAYQREWLVDKLEAVGRKVHELPYQPFYDLELNPQGLAHSVRPADDYFGVGRISRDDPNKFSHDMWRIMDRVTTPGPKKVFVLGYGPQVRKKCGDPLPTLDWMLWGAGGAPVKDVYSRLNVLIHKTGGSRENLPRVMMEAWHTGTPIVCENDYGFREHIENGVNGFRCDSSDEMSFRASQLAFDPELRARVAAGGLRYLKEVFGNADLCWKGWDHFFKEVSR